MSATTNGHIFVTILIHKGVSLLQLLIWTLVQQDVHYNF
jgi:hypothetical protein